jgi:acetyl-CoA synthetase
VLHTTGGYLVWASYTHESVFDLREDDIYWCTADVGWVTGHSYIVYGPLANGATALVFEGVPNYPSVSRFWEVIDRHKVTIFYTAPDRDPRADARRRGAGEEDLAPVAAPARHRRRTDQSEAWRWYYEVVGDARCPVVDTWWQTETGGVLISPLPGAIDAKPGSATLPFFGVQPALVDANGNRIEGEARATWCCSIPGRDRCARSMATTSASSTPTSGPIRAPTSPATAAAATPTVTTGSPVASTT